MTKADRDYILANIDTVVIPTDLRKVSMKQLFLNHVINQLGKSATGIDKERIVHDLTVFLYRCKKAGLNPMMGHTFGKYDHHKKFFQITGIHAARMLADKSGIYAGSSDVKYEYNPSVPDIPLRATISVKKIYGVHLDQISEATATAEFKAYAPYDDNNELVGFWKTQHRYMIGKCAEMLALRKAFPPIIGEFYIWEELEKHFQEGDNIENLKDKLTPDNRRSLKQKYNNKVKQINEKK